MEIGGIGAVTVVVPRIVEEERKPRNESVITQHQDMAVEGVAVPQSLLGRAIHTAVQVSGYELIITDSVVLWKIQKFDWLIPETK